MKKFICQICNKEYPTLSHLSRHINIHDSNKKQYYDKYLKKEKEGICPECGRVTDYTNKWQNAYKIYCSEDCKKKGVSKNVEKTTHKIYGVSNVNKLKKIRDKIDLTNTERYGNVCPMQNNIILKEIKTKNLKNLGVELPFQSKNIQKKSALVRKEKYGDKYTFQNQMLYQKCKNTMIEKYGAPFTLQSPDLFEKSFKSRILLKKYKDTEILFQGSYELDFLERYYHKMKISPGKVIKYNFKGKTKTYFSDFYIQDLNLIVEIKNKYLAKRDRYKLLAKRKAVISQGFNFIMIVDKNYLEFEKLLPPDSI